MKQDVARDATAYVVDDASIGVTCGAIAKSSIDELAKLRHRIAGAMASAVRTAERPKCRRIPRGELDPGMLR